MSFKDFFLHSFLINEETKFNVGDSIEGIFAICVGVYIADGKIDLNKLNNIRKETTIIPNKYVDKIIDSNIAEDGWIANKLPHINPGNKLSVIVKLNLKKSALDAFGPDAKPIPRLDDTINVMVKQIRNTEAIKRIEQFIIKVLTDRKPDDLSFYIVADGSQSATSSEELKGDVSLRIEAKTKTQIPQDIEAPLHFSIKTKNDKTSNLSIFTSILRLSNFFGLKFSKGMENMSSFPSIGGSSTGNTLDILNNKYKNYINDSSHLVYYVNKYSRLKDKVNSINVNDENTQELKNKAIEHALMYLKEIMSNTILELEKQIKNADGSYNFDNRVFNFLEREIFGSDNAEIVKLLPTSIEEVTKKDIDYLRNNYTVEASIVGNDIMFIGINKETQKRDVIFKIHPNIKKLPAVIEVVLGNIFDNIPKK